MSTTYENDEKTFSLCAINLRSSFEAGFCLVQRSICLIKEKAQAHIQHALISGQLLVKSLRPFFLRKKSDTSVWSTLENLI